MGPLREMEEHPSVTFAKMSKSEIDPNLQKDAISCENFPEKSLNEDEITARLKTRSVSLSRTDAKKKSPPKKKPGSPSKKIHSPSKGKKRKTPPEISPGVSVKER